MRKFEQLLEIFESGNSNSASGTLQQKVETGRHSNEKFMREQTEQTVRLPKKREGVSEFD